MKTIQPIAVILCLIAIATAYSLYSYFVAFQWDDLTFASTYIELNNGSRDFNFNTFVDLYGLSRAIEAGRISNLGTPFMVLFFPQWLAASIIGGVVALIIWLAAKLAVDKHRINLSLIALIWFGIILLIPWRDALMVKAYSLNYLVALATILIVTKLFTSPKWLNRRGIISTLAIALFSFLSGAIHEGFTLPTLCGMGLYAFSQRFQLSWRQWMLIGALASGAILILTGDYHQTRISEEVHSIPGIVDMAKSLILLCSGLILVTGSTLFMSISDKGRNLLRSLINSRWLLFVGIAVAGYCMSLIVKPSPRVGTCTQAFALIALVMMWSKFLPTIKPIWRKSTIFVITAICFTHIISVIIWQKKFYDEAETIYSKMIASDNGSVYHDIIPRDSAPLITLRACTDRTWIEPFQFYAIDLSLFNGTDKNSAVIPTALSQTDIIPDTIPGSATILSINGCLFSNDTTLARVNDLLQLQLSTDFVTEKTYNCMALQYISPDGIPKVYIHPYNLNDNVISANLVNDNKQ